MTQIVSGTSCSTQFVVPLPAEVSCSYKKGAEQASKKVDPPADGKVKASGTAKVSLNTSIGDLQLTLFAGGE